MCCLDHGNDFAEKLSAEFNSCRVSEIELAILLHKSTMSYDHRRSGKTFSRSKKAGSSAMSPVVISDKDPVS